MEPYERSEYRKKDLWGAVPVVFVCFFFIFAERYLILYCGVNPTEDVLRMVHPEGDPQAAMDAQAPVRGAWRAGPLLWPRMGRSFVEDQAPRMRQSTAGLTVLSKRRASVVFFLLCFVHSQTESASLSLNWASPELVGIECCFRRNKIEI